jgi:hypothetical protein
MTLTAEGRTISQSVVAIGIKYDLWEESFRMTWSVDDRELPALENIRRWVSRNSALPTSGAQTAAGGSSPSAVFFNAIFEQYAEGADIASTARDSATSAPFKSEQLNARPSGLQR